MPMTDGARDEVADVSLCERLPCMSGKKFSLSVSIRYQLQRKGMRTNAINNPRVKATARISVHLSQTTTHFATHGEDLPSIRIKQHPVRKVLP